MIRFFCSYCVFFSWEKERWGVQISPRAKKRRRGNKSYVSPPPFYHRRRRRNRQSRYLEAGMALKLPNVDVETRKLFLFPPVIGDFLFLLPEEERRRKGNYYFFLFPQNVVGDRALYLFALCVWIEGKKKLRGFPPPYIHSH